MKHTWQHSALASQRTCSSFCRSSWCEVAVSWSSTNRKAAQRGREAGGAWGKGKTAPVSTLLRWLGAGAGGALRTEQCLLCGSSNQALHPPLDGLLRTIEEVGLPRAVGAHNHIDLLREGVGDDGILQVGFNPRVTATMRGLPPSSFTPTYMVRPAHTCPNSNTTAAVPFSAQVLPSLAPDLPCSS